MTTAQMQEKKTKTPFKGKKPMKSNNNYANNPFGGLRNILISASKPNLHKWVKDGTDHINLGMGNSPLGSKLSFSGINPFKHSRLGRFKTLFGFWNYVANEEQDDRYRVLNDKEIRAFNRQRDIKRTPRRVRNFIAIVLDAQWQRISNNERLLNELKESTLPFDCYKLSGDVRERTSYEYWFVPAMEEMRKCIKNGTEFDVKPYMQDRNVDLYVDLIANPVVAEEAEEALKEDASNVVVDPRDLFTSNHTTDILHLDKDDDGRTLPSATWSIGIMPCIPESISHEEVSLYLDEMHFYRGDEDLEFTFSPTTTDLYAPGTEYEITKADTQEVVGNMYPSETGIFSIVLNEKGASFISDDTEANISYSLYHPMVKK